MYVLSNNEFPVTRNLVIFRDRSLSQPNVEDQVDVNLVIQNTKPKEKSLFGKTCVKHFKLFVNGFVMTFLAEWGDRSQLGTLD